MKGPVVDVVTYLSLYPTIQVRIPLCPWNRYQLILQTSLLWCHYNETSLVNLSYKLFLLELDCLLFLEWNKVLQQYQLILYLIHCTQYNIKNSLIHDIQYLIHYIQYLIHFIQYLIHYIQYPIHCTQYKWYFNTWDWVAKQLHYVKLKLCYYL